MVIVTPEVASPLADDHGDDPSTATAITVGDAVSGSIENEDDIGCFSFEAEAGEGYVITVELGTLGDSLLCLWGVDEDTWLRSNDDYTDTLASRIERIAPASGTYFLSVENADYVSTGTYTVTVDGGVPLLPDGQGDVVSDATPLTVGEGITGSIETLGDFAEFSFEAEAGQSYVITVELGALEDSYLTLWDVGGGKNLEENDDYGSTLASRIDRTASASGTYYAGVEGVFGATGTYTLRVEAVV